MQRARRFVQGHWQLIALIIVIFALWSTPVVLPLKILIVFLHELSHAMATLLTGGAVESLTIDPQEGGAVWSRGGNRFLTLSAGYCGSLLIGVALLIAAVRTDADRLIVAVLGGVILAVTGFYVRDAFALGFGVFTGVSMMVVARFLGHSVNDLLLRVIGLSSMIYVPYDIFSDTILHSELRSDARMLAEEFGGPTLFWGGAWLIISVGVIVFSLARGLGENSNIALRLPSRSGDHRT